MVCTPALAQYLSYPISDKLAQELARIRNGSVFERQVFFIRNLGFVAPTHARRISFEDALRFEQIHEETYRTHGFELIDIHPAPFPERIAAIRAHVEALR